MKHPTPEDLGEPTLRASGLQMWVHGRQFPAAQDYDDGNWLRVSVHCGAAGASVWASGAILEVTDLVRWANECEALAHSRGDTADLSPVEQELRVRLQRRDAYGHLSMRVEITPEPGMQEHAFVFDIDQTYLPLIIKQCRAIETTYPVRGLSGKGGV